jgi:hypothetical protein
MQIDQEVFIAARHAFADPANTRGARGSNFGGNG